MTIFFKVFFISLISMTLIACDGFEIESENGTSDPEKTFTRSELAFNVLFSSLLLNDSGLSNNRDGFIVLFKSTADLDEIELRNNDDNDALVGNYAWTIENDKLQVTYPNGVTCTSTKTAESGLEYTASNICDGGEPNNDRISNTLNKPAVFDKDNLSPSTIYIEDGDNDQRIDFYANDSFEITHLDSNGDDIANTTEVGTYDDSDIYNNVVKLDNADSNADEYRLLALLEGSLSSGTMLQLRYTKSTNVLKDIHIFTIDTSNRWDVDSVYDNISIDD